MRFGVFLVVLAVAGCASNSNYVFFPERSAQLDSQAQGVVAQLAAQARDRPGSKVQVIGFTDSAGSPQADVLLSKQRAKAVADALQADGVAPGRIVESGQGQTGSDPGIASRRVTVVVAP